MNSLQNFEALAWLAEIGADEAVGDRPGLSQWQGKVSLSTPKALEPKLGLQSVRPAQVREKPAQATKTAVARAAAPISRVTASSLDELRAELERFEGCDLKQTAMNLVFADGNPQAKIMVIGDVPAEDEDRQGIPFVGASGQLLDRMLAAIGLDRTSVYLTNMVFWRPPGNRTPSEAEVAACLPFTRQHIALVDPKVLLVLGSNTAKNLLHCKESFAKVRGHWLEYTPLASGDPHKPIRCLPTYHPSYLLRQPASKRQVWADLLNFKKEINELSP